MKVPEVQKRERDELTESIIQDALKEEEARKKAKVGAPPSRTTIGPDAMHAKLLFIHYFHNKLLACQLQDSYSFSSCPPAPAQIPLQFELAFRPAAPQVSQPEKKNQGMTLEEIEAEEGGPVKESLAPMAHTKRALGRKGKKAEVAAGQRSLRILP